jgi:hypothetical protein
MTSYLMQREDAGHTRALYRAKRQEAFRSVFEKTDRIIANEDVMVRIVADPKTMAAYPAWTDGKTVWLNGKMLTETLGNAELKDWVRHAKALNLHELCHVLFTPRKGAEIVRWFQEARWGYTPEAKNLQAAWNILEDQRIEMMFVARYRPAGAYFESMIIHWFFRTPEQMDTAYMLTHGRKYLPRHLQEPLEARFTAKWGVGRTKEAKSIIDAYNRITFPEGTAKAKTLIVRFAKLMVEMQAKGAEDIQPMINDHNPQENAQNNIEQGNQPDKKRQKEAQDLLDDVQPREPAIMDTNAEEAEDGEADGPGQPPGKEDAGDAAAPGDAGDDGKPEAGGGQDQVDEPSPEQQEPADELNGGADNGKGAGLGKKVPTQQEMNDIFQDAMDDLLADDKFNGDLDRVAKAVKDIIEEADLLAEGAEPGAEIRNVPDKIARAAKSMEVELRVMRVDLEECHNPRQQHGQIDAKRFLTRQPWEIDFFRSYDPGALEETDVEAVILVDQSGSMRTRMGEVSGALWATKKALEAMDARVTVLGFADQCYVLYQPNDKVNPRTMQAFATRGGTHPTQALTQAYRMLKTSRRKIKLLITLTDGEWQGDISRQEQLVSAIGDLDVVTSLMFITGRDEKFDKHTLARHGHNHQIVTHISDAEALTRNAVQIVERAMAKNVHYEQ